MRSSEAQGRTNHFKSAICQQMFVFWGLSLRVSLCQMCSSLWLMVWPLWLKKKKGVVHCPSVVRGSTTLAKLPNQLQLITTLRIRN